MNPPNELENTQNQEQTPNISSITTTVAPNVASSITPNIMPLQTLKFLLFVGLGLSCVMFLVDMNILPKQIIVSEKIKIDLFSFQSVFLKEKPKYADIANIQKEGEKISENASKNPQNDNSNGNSNDNLVGAFEKNPERIKQQKKNLYKKDTLAFKGRIQYLEDDNAPLMPFFKQLALLEKGRNEEIIRAVHLGDSQLEGDRITAYLRLKFQERFGGSGSGLQGLNNKNNSKLSVLQQNDNQWLTFPLFGKSPAPSSGFYGLLMNYYKFSEYSKRDSLGKISRFPTRAFAKFFRSENATKSDQKVENIKILYRNPTANFKLNISQNGKNIATETIEKSEEMNVFSLDLEGKFENLVVNFEGSISPEITGIALDSKTGITFDNVPMRGSSGLGFSKINKAHLKNQLEKLNVKLLILQFGANLDFKQKDYLWYEEAFFKELQLFKNLAPDVSILVIGTSDRSYNDGGNYVSYPSVAMIRDAQRNAAFRANCAFWDLYEVMGGRNSMPSWVFAKNPLAIKDFTHFTQKGANIVAEMLYDALIREYGFVKPLL